MMLVVPPRKHGAARFPTPKSLAGSAANSGSTESPSEGLGRIFSSGSGIGESAFDDLIHG
jgi:hypothetical protein